MARPPRIPMWLPRDQTVTYFITLCIMGRAPVLNHPNVFAVIDAFCRDHPHWRTLAAVVMPDHLHGLISPRTDREANVTQFSAGLKRRVRRETNASWKWQEGVFDRLLRREEFAESKWIYMRENPVRAGLVARWEDWPYRIGFEG